MDQLDYKEAVVECLYDGTTFVQRYYEFEDLIAFVKSLGKDYKVVDIY